MCLYWYYFLFQQHLWFLNNISKVRTVITVIFISEDVGG